MKSLFSALLIILFTSSLAYANDSSLFFSKYRNAIIPSSEGNIGENPQEIAQMALETLGINEYMEDTNSIDRISIVEALIATDFIFLGNIKSSDSTYNIQSYEEILFQFEKRKTLEGVKRITRRLKGNFNHIATSRLYTGSGYSMNNSAKIRPFKNFNQHSLVATALYSCDAELTEFLMNKGADNVSKGLPDTFAFFKTWNEFVRTTESGDAVYNHHRIVTPFNNFMSCLSLNGYWRGSEWVNYPAGNPIEPYMEEFVKKMITHYLNKPELDLNEFGCYPVIKDYAYLNFEWVRKMFTDKFGSDFAERCERNYEAYESSCKLTNFPNGGRDFVCTLRKY